ncbi:hypothetical protein [Luteimonas sp. e5]
MSTAFPTRQRSGRSMITQACAAFAFGLALAFIPTADAQTPQVRRCTAADGSTVMTDRPCAAIGAEERLPRLAHAGPARMRPYRGGCARTLEELSYEVAAAIDMQDANRLANSYHWAGLDTRSGYRVLARLEAIVKRPLLDIGPAGGGSDGEPQWVEDEEGVLVPIYPRPRPPSGLRIEQSLGRSAASSRTTFALRRHAGCLWISF